MKETPGTWIRPHVDEDTPLESIGDMITKFGKTIEENNRKMENRTEEVLDEMHMLEDTSAKMKEIILATEKPVEPVDDLPFKNHYTEPTMKKEFMKGETIPVVENAIPIIAKQTKAKKVATTQGKKMSTEEMIATMQDKIAMLQIVRDTVAIVDIPNTMSKSNRDTLLAYYKELEEVQNKYTQAIGTL